MSTKNKDELLKFIRDEVLSAKKSPLYTERKKNKVFPVIGEGNFNSRIMFVGEAPGANEDKTGFPFCGASGRLLDELLNSAGIKREEVYIANLLKCRPPKNRDPLVDELEACTPYLDSQIEAIKPKIISSLGRYSMELLMKKFGLEEKIEIISKTHGKIFNLKNGIKLIPLYHPAVAVYNANMKEVLIDDFKILKNI